MFKALIFDMDGTLVGSEQMHWRAWSETLSAYGVEIPGFDAFGKYVGLSDEQTADDFIACAALEIERARLIGEKRQRYLTLVPQIPLLGGVLALLKRSRPFYRLAVASSSPVSELMRILEHHRLEPLFEQVVGGDMVARKKPDPEIYLMVSRMLGLAPQDCLAFEDSQAGVESAKQAGLTVVAVPQSMSKSHDLSRADARLTSLLEADDGFLAGLAAAQAANRS